MKNFKQLVRELPSNKVVVAFGQFQPPTVGHEVIVKTVQKLGESADHVIYASVNEDKKNNPLPADRKVYFLKRMFPEANIKPAHSMQSIVEVALALNKRYRNLTVVAGSDKIAEYEKELHKNNGKLYQFESIRVISIGEADPDSNTVSPLSSVRMCESAKSGNFTQFKKGVPHTLTELDSRRLMNDVRKGMGLEPIRETIQFERSEVREDYVAGKIFNVGDIVESAGDVYEIVKRGSNHLLLKNQEGKLVSKWITDVQEITEESEMMDSKKVAMRYKEFLKKAASSEKPVDIGEPEKGDGKLEPKFGEKPTNGSEHDLSHERVLSHPTSKTGFTIDDHNGENSRRQKVTYVESEYQADDRDRAVDPEYGSSDSKNLPKHFVLNKDKKKKAVKENMDHDSKHDDPVAELKAALMAKKEEIHAADGDADKVYDIINKLMTAIAKAHDISDQKMHDMWVDQYKEIPDTWIMHEDVYSSDFKVKKVQNDKGEWVDRKYHPKKITFADRLKGTAAKEQPTQMNPANKTDQLKFNKPTMDKKSTVTSTPKTTRTGGFNTEALSFESWILNGPTQKDQEEKERKKNKKATSITTPQTKTVDDKKAFDSKSPGGEGGFDPFGPTGGAGRAY